MVPRGGASLRKVSVRCCVELSFPRLMEVFGISNAAVKQQRKPMGCL